MTDLRQAGDPFHVVGDGHLVTARKVFTGTGERLELVSEATGERVRLDAIALESVAWQDPETIADLAADVEPGSGGRRPDGPERDEPMRLRNEYADARVEKVDDERGQGLSIAAPKLGYRIRLGPAALAWLTTQDHDRFTEWLETPFGPDADEEH